MKNVFEIVKNLLIEKFDVKILDAPEKVIKDYDVYNKSYIVGDEIYIGKYDNDDFKMASMFHELGHHLITDKRMRQLKLNRYKIEKECWKIGLNEAKSNNISFSIQTYRLMIESLNSYKG